ncbi:hypothetical protein GH714_024409 [Hevea brasiliensis]|uniref:Pentacotripeptide-repeat region of PRORP domain-containing protein n=1 Tax=Hevea brasiliensis TaxID=3981 RepID=A0A6A6KVI9_HEVBR|nr:hypothetical protein GH714_024409 [Hevea brasiliensis]
MLSLTCFSLNNTLLIQPSLLAIQPLQSPKTRSNSHVSPTNFHCLSCNNDTNSTSASQFRFSTANTSAFEFQGSSDVDLSGTQLATHFVDSGVLALWLRSCYRAKEVKRIHAVALKCLRNSVTYVNNNMISAYLKLGQLIEARKVFDGMPERNVVSWTAMINGYISFGLDDEALSMCCPKGLRREKALRFGKQLHGAIVKKMYKDDVFIGSSLVDMYAKCGEILDSRKVFNRMRKRNTVTWTSIIAGYARKGLGEEAISLFQVMKQRRVISNNLTVVSILKACGSIRALLTGQEVHAQIIKNRIQSNEYIGSTLVWFYCKCGEFHIASKVLEQIPLRSVVSWTAMISGYAGLGHEPEALEFLKEMMEEGVEPNAFTCSSALKACANLDAILQGKLIHSFANKTPASSNVFVGSALIYMYSKCGYLSDAIQVFDSMPERNLISWKTMILGYARNGRCREALKLMYRMQAEGIEMDDYIFTSVMGACGDVEWNMEPSSKHCLLS